MIAPISIFVRYDMTLDIFPATTHRHNVEDICCHRYNFDRKECR